MIVQQAAGSLEVETDEWPQDRESRWIEGKPGAGNEECSS